jgi:DNA-directed RNA polymerase specialized sigma24 family protein
LIDAADPRALSLQAVADHCAERIDPACFELFRRALAGGDQRAWACLLAQYSRLVGFWVRQHPRLAECGEEVDYFVNATFARMARAITPDKFGNYEHVGQLIAFLKRCAFTAVIDHARDEQRQPMMLEATGNEAPPAEPPPGDPSDDWRRCIEPRLRGPKERLVAYASWVLDLPPREIIEAWPAEFENVQEIFKVKANLIERLRRDPELRDCLGGG